MGREKPIFKIKEDHVDSTLLLVSVALLAAFWIGMWAASFQDQDVVTSGSQKSLVQTQQTSKEAP